MGNRFTDKEIFNRSELLLGERVMRRIAASRVIIFGIGGVGSWCAESLVRSGFRHLTLVDSDSVSVTNINRQAMATVDTVGAVKVDVMKARLLSISPDAEITALQEVYSADSAGSFHLEDYDFVVDAIDSLSNKMELILHVTSIIRQQKVQQDLHRTTFFSAMGAALKVDPLQIRVSEFWDIDGCPLARALRKRMKSQERFPASKFRCVWSPEVARMQPHPAAAITDNPSIWDARKAQINGSLSHITAIFGFTLAGEIVKTLYNN